MNILVCSLGGSWQVVPEVLGLVAPDTIPLYEHHPRRASLIALREQFSLREPDELWLVTTESSTAHVARAALERWLQACAPALTLRVWSAAGVADLKNLLEVAALRELILRLVLMASAHCGDAGQLLLSLAGGRKTMSADLQRAGQVFGAHALLHVVGDDAGLRGLEDDEFKNPLSADRAVAITPLVVGFGARSDLLEVPLDGATISAERYPLPMASFHCMWKRSAEDAELHEALQARERESAQLLGNYVQRLGKAEHHENWRTLYRLPPRHIERLRQRRLMAQDRDWLVRLPKADLHRHLGGSLSLDAQRRVADAIWCSLSTAAIAAARDSVGALVHQERWSWTWPTLLKSAELSIPAAMAHRAACAALLLREAPGPTLRRNLLGVPADRLALRESSRGFAAYERPGELSGSALLGHPAAVATYAAEVLNGARAEGLRYLELRGSPQKYCPQAPASFLFALRAGFRAAGGATAADEPGEPRVAFIWILDRREPHRMADTVSVAVATHEAAAGFLVGFDLAGAEGTASPETLSGHFLPAFERCLSLTIHAGEGEPAKNIWEAAYHLHADRIGHGLTLAQQPALMQRFRNRGICLELCPTSNREVVGFRDPGFPVSLKYPQYPMREFLDAGISLTVCTDNPGFSDTTLADEFLTAARMLPDGLSLWETLMLIKQGFRHAFLAASERESLLKAAEQKVYEMALSA